MAKTKRWRNVLHPVSKRKPPLRTGPSDCFSFLPHSGVTDQSVAWLGHQETHLMEEWLFFVRESVVARSPVDRSPGLFDCSLDRTLSPRLSHIQNGEQVDVTCLQNLNTVPAKMNLHTYLACLNPSVQMHLYLNNTSSLFELFLVQALLARIHTITFFLARHF